MSSIGIDRSGNGNNWTSNNLNQYDVMLDSPTNNFCTLNQLDNVSTTYSEGNLKITQSSFNYNSRGSVSVSSGKWYWEIKMSSTHGEFGVCEAIKAPQTDPQGSFPFYFIYNNGSAGVIYNNATGQSTSTATMTNWGANDICQIAYDADNGKLYHGLNGVWQNSANPASGSGAIITGIISRYSGDLVPFIGSGTSSARTWIANFGSDSSFAGTKTPQGKQDGNGIGDFFYPVPNSFLALCSANLPSVDVIPSENFNTAIYTGNATARNIDVGFQSDFVWIKARSLAYSHRLVDSIRGVTKTLESNNDNAEITESTGLTAFNSTGFALGTAGGYNENNGTFVAWNWKAGGATPSKTYTVTVVSDSGNKYRFDGFGTSAVTINLQEGGTYKFDQSHSSNSGHPFRFGTSSNAYNYSTGVTTSGTPGNAGAYTQITLAANAPALYYSCSSHSGMGGAVNTNTTFGSSNFNGSIVSTVSANVDAGFSIVTYSGASNATSDGSNNGGAYWRIGHSLAQAPEVVLVKTRSSQASWYMGHQSLSSTPWASGSHVKLNTSDANANESNILWGNATPTSTVFAVGGWNVVNRANSTYLAYCFHSVVGYSKVGKYVGNGNVNGVYVNCGFSPAVIITKSTGSGGWRIIDNKRTPFNPSKASLYPDDSAAEYTGTGHETDFTANGFKMRNSNSRLNTNNQTYIFIAFAENPFKHSNAR